MRAWPNKLAATALGAGSGFTGLMLANCRGHCGACGGCIGGALLGLLILAGARRRPKSYPHPEDNKTWHG